MRDKKFLQIVTEETLATDENEKQLIFENIKRSISSRETKAKKKRFIFSRYGLAAVSMLILSVLTFILPFSVKGNYINPDTPYVPSIKEPEEIYYAAEDLESRIITSLTDFDDVYPTNLSIYGFYADRIQLFFSKEAIPVDVFFTIRYHRTEITEMPFDNDIIFLTVYLVEKYVYGLEGSFSEKSLQDSMNINIGEAQKTINYSDTLSESGSNNTKTKFTSGKLTYYIDTDYFPYNIDTFEPLAQGEFLNNILTQLF